VSKFYPQSSPAFRLVDQSLSPIFGPHALGNAAGAGEPNGFFLGPVRVSYTPDWQGPIKKMTWEQAPVLNGFRLEVEMDFELILADRSKAANTYGIGLLQKYFDQAVAQSLWAPLQFNLFYGAGSTTWRGMYPMTPFAPSPAQDKETAGFSMKVNLVARELIPNMTGIDWAAFQW
jgi:hypothetical protein